jgi:uncharacterized protein
MAKPSGSACNMDCEYCFYLEKELLYPDRRQNWKMSDKTLETFIIQHIQAQPANNVEFAWQGGEPTLLGLAFFEKAVRFCNQYRGSKTVTHTFQTNGLKIDDEWCRFFKTHNVLVGVSIDGPQDLHDRYRVARNGKGTHAQVESAIERLKKHGVEFNTLSVINNLNVKQPLRVYQYLKSIGSSYIQFIPLVERQVDGSSTPSSSVALKLAGPTDLSSQVTSWSVETEEYGHFLNTVFDQWVRNDVGETFVPMFDSTLASWLGFGAASCVFSRTCGHAFALEANGDLYQCDHYVYPEYKLGNIHQTSIKKLNRSTKAIVFGQQKSLDLGDSCQSCEFQFACFGGCPKHRFINDCSGKPNHNYLCVAYQMFFTHTKPYMITMANLFKQRKPVADIMRLSNQVAYLD